MLYTCETITTSKIVNIFITPQVSWYSFVTPPSTHLDPQVTTLLLSVMQYEFEF